MEDSEDVLVQEIVRTRRERIPLVIAASLTIICAGIAMCLVAFVR